MNFVEEEINHIREIVIDQIFKTRLPSLGFHVRQPQLEMANDILDMVKNKNKCLVVEAGVGTGKSFAYLIPLLILQINDPKGFSIILSRGTISLQEQLLKDINMLMKVLKLRINVILAKGKTHFLCLNRFSKQFSKGKMPEWVKYWNTFSYYGDRAELDKEIPNLGDIWDKINVDNCKSRTCDHYNECGYIKLRNDMRQPRSIIVTNHDQLIANAKNINNFRRPLFPQDSNIIVVDEAHNLEEKARSSLTEQWSKNRIKFVLKTADNYLRKSDDYESTKKRKKNIENLVTQFFQELSTHCESEAQKSEKNGHEAQRFSLPNVNEKLIYELVNELNSYNISLQLIDSASDDFEVAIESLEDLMYFLNTVISDENKIFWCEFINRSNSSVSINSVPKELNEIINEYFFSDGKPPVILTSATISQPGNEPFEQYDYLISTLGIDFLKYTQVAVSEPKQSPFNYKDNTLLYIPADMPLPKDWDNFRKQAVSEIVKLLSLTDGRSMILFTSKSDMNFVYSKLLDLKLPWSILIQKEGSSQDEIKQEFINDEKSILLATGTFWEGIDIPGPSLSNLIVFKLPFPVPDPVLEYKKSISSDGFLEVYLPEMLIKLRQGLGRLIRKETDKGIATILDSRINKNQNKSYRTTVLASLPFINVTEDFQEVSEFVKSVLKL